MIRVTGDRVLIQLPPKEDEIVTDSGIVLLRDPDLLRVPTRGIVVALGTKSNTCDLDDARRAVHQARLDGEDVDRALQRLVPAPFEVQVGDCVLFPVTAGDSVQVDGMDYVVLSERDILGVVEQNREAA